VTFDHPYLLLTLLVIPAAVAGYVLVQRRRMRYAVRFTNLEVLAQILPRRSWRRHVPLALFLLALATLCAALTRPHVKTLVARENATVILVVDTSGSMQADDVKPTRLGAAQAAVRKFLDKVPKRMRVGLISFAGEAQVAAPPTTDHELVRQALDDLGVFDGFGYGGGTAIGDALAAAVDLAQQNAPTDGGGTIALRTPAATSRPAGTVSILFLSDGHQTRGYLQPLDGAARAKAASIPVNTIALGTPDGVLYPRIQGFDAGPIPVPPDPATLRAIAEATGGKFFATRSAAAVESAYQKLGSSLGREPGRSEVTYAFLAGAAAVLLAAGLLSALWAPRLP
jgi:Ca-activated chloride channel family protein